MKRSWNKLRLTSIVQRATAVNDTKDTELTDFKPIHPQSPLPIQQNDRDKHWKLSKIARFVVIWL